MKYQYKHIGLFLSFFLILILLPRFCLKEGLAGSGSQAFCSQYSGFNLETACNRLTKHNCGNTSCCIWTSDDKCKAGNASGPTFNSNAKGKTLPLPYFYFENKCYGEKCP